MKRDPRLRDLSEDHHHALVLARHAVNAGSGQGPRSPRDIWGEVVRRFDEELAPHFDIEERLLLPALTEQGEHELVARTQSDHARLRSLVHDDERPLAARLAEFGSVLADHVRFEERTLFPVAEERLSERSLDGIAQACAKMRSMKAQREELFHS